mmetsp:Transcript_1111/g.1452  ORF Transcript_1111/g.1452 Transcript_1111/m.1452 type:complete len:213 (-) Transcript_1111:103-741(-)
MNFPHKQPASTPSRTANKAHHYHRHQSISTSSDTSSSWVCSTCTFQNLQTEFLACEICGSPNTNSPKEIIDQEVQLVLLAENDACSTLRSPKNAPTARQIISAESLSIKQQQHESQPAAVGRHRTKSTTQHERKSSISTDKKISSIVDEDWLGEFTKMLKQTPFKAQEKHQHQDQDDQQNVLRVKRLSDELNAALEIHNTILDKCTPKRLLR